MQRQNTLAVIGAGVIGAAVAYALTREGRHVLLLDRTEPGVGGASFANVGHIAAELVQPLPSWGLVFGFWRELFAFGGPLDIPVRRLSEFLPWARRFAAAAGHRTENTQHLAPLVTPAVREMARWLQEVGRPELLRTNGHFEIWLGPKAEHRAAEQARVMRHLGIPTQAAPNELLGAVTRGLPGNFGPRTGRSDNGPQVAGLRFTNTGHVLDPLEIVQTFVGAAVQRGAEFKRTKVQALELRTGGVDLHTTTGLLRVSSVVVCAGVWSAGLLEPLGLRVPMEGARGYYVELAGHESLADAPIVYADAHLVVTPMRGRLRASGFMEFAGLDALPDARKPARMRAKLRALGYLCPREGLSWVGSRPVLPDYLPGIGRLAHTPIFYAIGHQHIGLTMAPVTGELIADLVAGRASRHDISGFDLCRFGPSRKPKAQK
jgi:glycine/D-amino acid oxidase-like deaminating enzyme